MACSRSQWLILVSAAFVLFPPQPVFVHGWGCWYPDGSTPAPDTPCNQTAVDNGQTSACCGADAMCMDNGLCFGKGIVSRGSCTDKNWGEPCTQYCQDIGESGGMPLTPCDPFTPTFTCGTNTTNCQTGLDVFEFVGGNDFILRGEQVAPLQGGDSVAMSLGPRTTLTADGVAAGGSSNGTGGTVTITASPDSSGSSADAGYTVADVAGAAAGAGGAFLLAFIGALIVIFNLRRKIRKLKNEQKENAEKLAKAHHHSFGGMAHSPAPRYTSPLASPPAMQYNAGGAYFAGYDQPKVSHDDYRPSPTSHRNQPIGEMDDREIREMGSGGAVWEMDASHGQGKDGQDHK